MGTTANYSWPYPESTDFVADGATAIENLADAVDTTVSGFGAWADYIPSFSGLTFSSYFARWAYVNNLVTVWFHGIVATATGLYEIGMPTVVLPGTTNAPPIGNVYALDASTSTIYTGYASTRTNDSVRFVNNATGGLSYWSNTGPFTWVSGDVLAFSVTYEKG